MKRHLLWALLLPCCNGATRAEGHPDAAVPFPSPKAARTTPASTHGDGDRLSPAPAGGGEPSPERVPQAGEGGGVVGAATGVKKGHVQTVVKIELKAHPATISMTHLDAFRVGFKATNLAERTIDPGLDSADLYVNGERSLQWMASFGNGVREKEWRALPPGHSVQREWAIGPSLFPRPGSYHLLLRVGSQEVAPVDIHVTE